MLGHSFTTHHTVILIVPNVYSYNCVCIHYYAVTEPPINVMTVQESPTSIRLSWSPSSDATGYIISYTGGNVTVSGGFISEQLLIGLQNGVTYTISMVATSNQLPSARVVAMDVHLGMLV